MSTPTPRTDANERALAKTAKQAQGKSLFGFCEASFARGLEREVAELTARLNVAREPKEAASQFLSSNCCEHCLCFPCECSDFDVDPDIGDK